MSYAVTFAKDRFKFSAAHFTLFPDGTAERLHGHNYRVRVTLRGKRLKDGLLFPFHLVKPLIDQLCEAWDERVLLPAHSAWVRLSVSGAQRDVRVDTPLVSKRYSFPEEDVVLLNCDNTSLEQLARLFANALSARLGDLNAAIEGVEVSISESRGQSVTYTRKL